MKRSSRKTPARSEIALVATTALTSATMIFACLIVPITAVAGPLRASWAPAPHVGRAENGSASRPTAAHALAHIAGASTDRQPTPSAIAASKHAGDTACSAASATRHRALTPCKPLGCSLARGQPRTDALT